MINVKKYLTDKDKDTIQDYCNRQLEVKDKIRVKHLATILDKHYALFELMDYIKHDLGISKDKIFWGSSDYLYKLPRGHIQLSDCDVYFKNCYIHQYVICMELDTDIKDINKYIVHHMNEDKENNDVSNLWLFFDTNNHISYHQALLRGEEVELMKFTLDYIESILNDSNVEEVKAYLKLLHSLEKLKKDNKNKNLLLTTTKWEA